MGRVAAAVDQDDRLAAVGAQPLELGPRAVVERSRAPGALAHVE
jgi:hypothetical protein